MFPGLHRGWVIRVGPSLLGLFLSVAGNSAAPSNSSDYLIKSWTMDDGLPSTLVSIVEQSEDGYLWLATGASAVRFDGVRFVTSGLGQPNLIPLVASRPHQLWCRDRENRLFIRENSRFRMVPLPPGVTGVPTGVQSDSNGVTWIRISSRAYPWKGGRWLGFEESGSVPSYVAAGREGSAGVWWCNREKIAGRWKAAEFKTILMETGDPAPPGSVVLPRRSGGAYLLAAVSEGAYIFHTVSESLQVSEATRLPWKGGIFLQGVLEDRMGNFWMSSTSHGVLRRGPDGVWEEFNARKGLPIDHARLMLEDLEGNIWVGTDGGGLSRLTRRTFRTYGVADGLTTDNVYAVAPARAGGIWIGAHGNRFEAVFRLEKDRAEYIDHLGAYAWSVHEDPIGDVWAGNLEVGLHRLHGEEKTPVPGSPASVFAICDDGEGGIWFGGMGVWRVKNRMATNFLGVPKSVTITSLVRDQEGVIWAGSKMDGLYEIEGEKVTRYTVAEGLLSNEILALYVDKRNSLWIGSEQGITRRLDGKFLHLTQTEGLVSRAVSGMAEDRYGTLWVHSRAGFSSIRVSDLEDYFAGKIKRVPSFGYGREDGLATATSTVGSQPRVCQDRDGRIWFSTLKGAAVVDPATRPIHTNFPPVVIEEVFVQGKLHSRPMKCSQAPAEAGARIEEFEPGLRQFGVRFTATHLTNPSRTRFRYRLEGLNPNWVEVGDRREVLFDQLSHGNYRLEVSACNSLGSWNPQPAVFAFTVLPFFWETTPFKAGVSTAGIALLVIIVRTVSTRPLRRRLQVAEKEAAVERERTRISRDMHDELGARLTKISLLGELAKRSMCEPGEAQQHLEKLSGLATETSESLGELIWTVKPANDSGHSLASHLCQHMEEYLRESDIRCRFDLAEAGTNAPVPSEVRRQMVLAVKEAINNIVKHSGATEATLSFRVSESEIVCAISDNGRGLTLGTPTRTGGGNGLVSLRQRFEHLGGQCEITNREEGGVRVDMRVPIARF
jgi:signal transduction histidine kinase/ligand-binding sensor domain-containing protein